MNKRFTSERITSLERNEIFVFGSNLAGSHGGGAARLAYAHFGAVWCSGRPSSATDALKSSTATKAASSPRQTMWSC